MNVLITGGAGTSGRAVARLLDGAPSISSVTLVDRALDPSDIDTPDRVEVADITDRRAIDDVISRDSIELVVNTAGPYRETLIPVLESAISSGIAYVDMVEGATETLAAMALAEQAETAGSVCWIGMGTYPGLTNMLAMSAANRLDRVESITVALAMNASAVIPDRASIADMRSTVRIGAGWRSMLEAAAPPFFLYRDGDVTRESTSHRTSFVAPSGDEVSLSVQSHAESVTLPKALRSLTGVTTYLGFVPREADEVFRDQVNRAATGETSAADAVITFMETIADGEGDYESPLPAAQMWAEANGMLDGQRTSIAAWAPGSWATASRVLAEAALAVADGRLDAPGVHTPEKIPDVDEFLAHVARRAGVTDRPLIHHRVTAR